jgi:hypothetical protein
VATEFSFDNSWVEREGEDGRVFGSETVREEDVG